MANYIDYETYLQSGEWKKKRERVLLFWKGKCALCSSSKKVDVHHRTYERLGHELLTDLLALCNICHARHHNYIRAGRPEPIKATLTRLKQKAGL